MANGWVKSLQCKSRAFEDVFNPAPRHLISSSSCRNSGQSIKDVVDTATATAAGGGNKKQNPAKPSNHHRHQHGKQQKPATISQKPPKSKLKPDSVLTPEPRFQSARNHPDPLFPALNELPEGHPSRNVVEIIFHTSWSDKSFPGRIEMIFKVQNGSRTVTRFEEYREIVKSRAGLSGGPTWEVNTRCVADGNEMMRFHSLGPAGGVQYDCGGGGAWVFPGGKGSGICTFSGSGGAHERAGGGRGRRAMLVCRVIAGRVSKQIGLNLLDGRVGFDSLSGENGELLVFDSRAVLPCFLIIYKL
uniref:Uncharacterized protein n=1 Tax=Rhizophora mucronata TaxID=61149 RepID=A0A2P2N8L4_RHIMU